MSPHPARDVLVRFAEDRCSESQAREVYGHLIRCSRCLREYADLSVLRSVWLRGELDLPAAPPRSRLFRRLAVGVACISVIALLARDAPERFRPATALAGAVGRVSLSGLVLPGAETFDGTPGPAYRSAGPGTALNALEEALAESRRQPGSPEGVAWTIAGLLAADRVDDARLFADRTLERFPEDARFAVLRAAVAYRESRLDEAEAHLRRAVAIAPEDPTARFDLAAVLLETGRLDEATVLAREVVAQSPRSLPGRRAETLLRTAR